MTSYSSSYRKELVFSLDKSKIQKQESGNMFSPVLEESYYTQCNMHCSDRHFYLFGYDLFST